MPVYDSTQLPADAVSAGAIPCWLRERKEKTLAGTGPPLPRVIRRLFPEMARVGDGAAHRRAAPRAARSGWRGGGACDGVRRTADQLGEAAAWAGGDLAAVCGVKQRGTNTR
ncbi:hypothetical protein GW17_00045709 [Ensete ventricosum]|uniref:Uncharacterized protein n=1 Tax=Ensete ventricosum TaxID=4639 RepID=A0A426Y326_ENSVE|nr:hypothetical protein B296_00054635 [Ensete ventricosum]RWV91961.1 hypothetical protein GW17_00045709 [Ensete ventricosum]